MAYRTTEMQSSYLGKNTISSYRILRRLLMPFHASGSWMMRIGSFEHHAWGPFLAQKGRNAFAVKRRDRRISAIKQPNGRYSGPRPTAIALARLFSSGCSLPQQEVSLGNRCCKQPFCSPKKQKSEKFFLGRNPGHFGPKNMWQLRYFRHNSIQVELYL